MMMKINVDFGEVEGPWLAALREGEVSDAVTGQVVLLVDADRNACYGTVQKIDETMGLVYVEPDWTTWIGHAEKWEIRTAMSQGIAQAPFCRPDLRTTAPSIEVNAPMSIRYA